MKTKKVIVSEEFINTDLSKRQAILKELLTKISKDLNTQKRNRIYEE